MLPEGWLFRQSLERVKPVKTRNPLGDLFIFAMEKVFELAVVFRNKRLGADNAGIGKISGAVSKAVDLAQFEIAGTLFFHNAFIQLNPFFRCLDSLFIKKPAGASQSLL